MEFSEILKRAIQTRDKLNAAHKPWGFVEHTEGFVGDVGDLIKLIMAKKGFRSYVTMENLTRKGTKV